MADLDLNAILSQGAIIDNRRTQGPDKVTLKEVLRAISKNSDGLKCAVGYFYFEGLSHIIDSLRTLREIKILMGIQTTRLTKDELINAFKDDINSIEETDENISSLTHFHELVKESMALKVRIYLGTENEFERLHSKAYIFIDNVESNILYKRYNAGIVGSSNLTPSGLMANTELNVILTKPEDLQYVEKWFDNLWEIGSEDFQRLRIADAVSMAIEQSKFERRIKEIFEYIKPEEFFKILIRYMNADYLFENWKESGLLGFQQLDSIRCLRLFNEKNYRGVFLTSSVGLGKSYVACQCAKYYLHDDKKILLVAPSGLIENKEQWPRYLKEFKIFDRVDILPMGLLQKDPFKFEYIDLQTYEKHYSLIIVDEAHNYRNEDAFRTRNLKAIIDRNGDSKILFLTATPINTQPDDLINLIKLFYRTGSSIHFDKLYRGLSEMLYLISDKSYEELTQDEKELISNNQEIIERELFVKSTRETIKTSAEYVEEIKSFSGVDISQLPDPDIYEIDYSLDEKYKEIVNGIVNFISDLRAANLRIVDPEKGARLGGFFKWVLYKRFESDISSYYLTLKRIYKKNCLILEAFEKRDPTILSDTIDQEDEIDIKFDLDYREKVFEIIQKIKAGQGQQYLAVLKDLEEDIKLVHDEVKELEFFLQPKNQLLFIDDKKLSKLFDQVRKNPSSKILVFTEYTDTLKAIKEFFGNRFGEGIVEYIESGTKKKTKIIDKFNKDERPRILIATDTISEGYNIGRTDIVVNFDIPYNPVRLIQRIGRATRLDSPKPIKVLNFRPADDIDKEIDLVDRLQLRIEDIIRFIGVEYRIWFERERDLLADRRKRDIKIYLEILKGIRKDLWKGDFSNLEVPIHFTRPILSLIQKAILKYKISKNDVKNKSISHNSYTLLKGKKNLSFYYPNAKSYNENIIDNEIIELNSRINFESVFSSEIAEFRKYLETEKQEETVLRYYNDKIDKRIRNIIDLIISKGYNQIYPSAKQLLELLRDAKDKCGATTDRVIRSLLVETKSNPSDKIFRYYIEKLENSYTRRVVQKTLSVEDEKPYLALGFVD